MGPMAWLQKVTIYTAGWKRIGNTQKWKELMGRQPRQRKLHGNGQWVQLFAEKASGAIPFTVVC